MSTNSPSPLLFEHLWVDEGLIIPLCYPCCHLIKVWVFHTPKSNIPPLFRRVCVGFGLSTRAIYLFALFSTPFLLILPLFRVKMCSCPSKMCMDLRKACVRLRSARPTALLAHRPHTLTQHHAHLACTPTHLSLYS